MGENSAEIGRRAAEAFADAVTFGEIDDFMALVADDVDYASFSPVGPPVEINGSDALRAYLERVAPQYDALSIRPREFRKLEGGPTLMRAKLMARPHGGTTIGSPLANVFEVRDGKVSWVRAFTDEQAALNAAAQR
jgi:ketosteroid isomerase-like protein